jgi:hypothetical protein
MSTTTKLFECTLIIPENVEVSGDMGDKFVEGLTINATRINERRKAKIGSDGVYINTVATPASQMIDASFVSRKGRNVSEIVGAHVKNMSESFNKWNDNLNLAFAEVDGVPAKRFVDNVTNKKGNWEAAAGKKTLRMTGDRVRGRGAAAIMPELLCGYSIAQSWFRPGDVWIAGVPTKVVLAGLEGSVKASLTSLLVRCGLTIIQNNYDATIMAAHNAIIASLLTGMRDDSVCDAFKATIGANDTGVIFELVDNIFQLHAKVQLTA